MKKINFVNNDAPYLSAENLNQMQSNIEDAVEEKQIYSTEEQVIGTWMGKPLYRKTLHITSGFAETMNVVHNISNLDIATNIYGTCYFFGSWKPIPTIYLSDQVNYDVSVYQITPIDIMLLIGKLTVSSITQAYITIEYTKTTD